MKNFKQNKKKLLNTIGDILLYYCVSLFVCYIASIIEFVVFDNIYLSALAMTIGWKLYHMLSDRFGWFKN